MVFFKNRERAFLAADALTDANFEPLIVSTAPACLNRLRHYAVEICVVDDETTARSLRKRVQAEGIGVPVVLAPGLEDQERFATSLRIKVLTVIARKPPGERGRRIAIGDTIIDPLQFDALVDGAPVRLRRGEFEVLYLLALARGAPMGVAELALKLGLQHGSSTRKLVTTRIARLRMKLRDASSEIQIRNRRSVGWFLEPAVSVEGL